MQSQEPQYEPMMNSRAVTFDVKAFVFKFLSHWKLVLLSLIIAFSVAYYINVRKQNIYRLEALVAVDNDNNPFFTSNTSISFNRGGTSDKVGKIMTEIKTRNHNEKVIDSLGFYQQYLQQGKYRLNDVYTKAPFVFKIDKSKPQLLGKPILIRFIDSSTYEISVDFQSSKIATQYYDTRKTERVDVEVGEFKKEFNVGAPISLSFLSGTLNLQESNKALVGSEYYVRFLNFDRTVERYRTSLQINPISQKNSSVLKLSLIGVNKSKIVDYLNATVNVLSREELKRKNLYATNTIKFIDSSLAAVNTDLKDVIDEMNNFQKQNSLFDIDSEIALISNELRQYEKLKLAENDKVTYLDNLKNYLLTKTDYTKIAAPSSVGIEDGNIASSVSNITALSVERQNLEYTTKEGNVLFKDLDRRIDAEKNVLLETIDAVKNISKLRLNTINTNIGKSEYKLSQLPEDQQEFLKIQRKLNISQQAYDVYMAKRSEAAVVKAANVSDIVVIDEAKDIGKGLIGPDKSLNYMKALLLGVAIPFLIVFLLFVLDNTIHSVEDVMQLSNIPILGLVGKFKHANNLVVYEEPKAPISESFRAIRSSLQYMYKRQEQENTKGKTLMVTSSISGEGKTFCSINIATVYALSGKKTILLGLDLRKPKIFNDFDITNEVGMVNYLIGQNSFEEIVKKTHIENLDIVASGPIPPNPSELLMSQALEDLLNKLREEYDIIILDTPPLGLVTDAFELSQHADASIYMIRLDYTKKGMLQLINSKYRTGEIKNLSFLLNFYKPKRGSDYSYGYGYGYGYGVYGDKYRRRGKRETIKEWIKKYIG